MNVSTEYTTIAPHGGELVDRRAPEEQREELLQQGRRVRRRSPWARGRSPTWR